MLNIESIGTFHYNFWYENIKMCNEIRESFFLQRFLTLYKYIVTYLLQRVLSINQVSYLFKYKVSSLDFLINLILHLHSLSFFFDSCGLLWSIAEPAASRNWWNRRKDTRSRRNGLLTFAEKFYRDFPIYITVRYVYYLNIVDGRYICWLVSWCVGL